MIPSGPGADPVLVFRKASSTCLREIRSVIGPENWSARLMAASRNTMSTICDAVVTVPPSMAAKALTHPSATLVALANPLFLGLVEGIGALSYRWYKFATALASPTSRH